MRQLQPSKSPTYPAIKYKCLRCGVYTSGAVECKNCGAARQGREREL